MPDICQAKGCQAEARSSHPFCSRHGRYLGREHPQLMAAVTKATGERRLDLLRRCQKLLLDGDPTAQKQMELF